MLERNILSEGKMGTVIHHGWRTSSDEIPQPVGTVMGANLRKQPARPTPVSERERVMQSIARVMEASFT